MDAHLPPMAFYGVLALAVGVTAKVTEKDVREGQLLQGRPWLLRLLHVPVGMAWLQVCIFLVSQLVVARISLGWPEYLHVVMHTFVLGFVGAVCACTYDEQLRQRRVDTAEW